MKIVPVNSYFKCQRTANNVKFGNDECCEGTMCKIKNEPKPTGTEDKRPKEPPIECSDE